MNLPSNIFSEKIEALPDVVKEATTEEIEAKVRPTRQLKILRRRYNEKLAECACTGQNLTLADVCRGVVNTKYFYKLITDPYKLAYITSPIQQVEDEFKVLEAEFLKGLHEIAEAGPFSEGVRTGEYLKAAEMVLSRTAPAVQRTQVQNMTVKKTITELDDRKLDEKLSKLLEGISEVRPAIEAREASTDTETGGGEES